MDDFNLKHKRLPRPLQRMIDNDLPLTQDMIDTFYRSKKMCPMCNKEKTRADFNLSAPTQGCKDGLRSECKECQNIATQRSYTNTSPEHRRKLKLKLNYELDIEDYTKILQYQDFKCAICKCDLNESTPHLDHDHVNLMIRGILCKNCNMHTLSSHIDPDPIAILQNAINYLEDPPAIKAVGVQYASKKDPI